MPVVTTAVISGRPAEPDRLCADQGHVDDVGPAQQGAVLHLALHVEKGGPDLHLASHRGARSRVDDDLSRSGQWAAGGDRRVPEPADGGPDDHDRLELAVDLGDLLGEDDQGGGPGDPGCAGDEPGVCLREHVDRLDAAGGRAGEHPVVRSDCAHRLLDLRSEPPDQSGQ